MQHLYLKLGVTVILGFSRCPARGATLRIAAEPTSAATDLELSTAHVRRRATTSTGNALSARPTRASLIFLRRHVGDVIFCVAV